MAHVEAGATFGRRLPLRHLHRHPHVYPAGRGGLAVAEGLAQRLAEGHFGPAQRYPVLGPGRAGQARFHAGEVELDALGEHGLDRRVEPQALVLGVRLHQLHVVLGPAGEPQVAQRLVVDGEYGAGGTVLGGHVADGGPVVQGDLGHTGPVELHELAHYPPLAQQLGHGEDQVRGRRALGQFADQLEPDDIGDEHGHRLAEHGRFGLDAPDAPSQHSEPVDHGRVRVGAEERVRVRLAVFGENDPGQVLQVVTDARVGRDDLQAGERLLAPAQEPVALLVALELELGVAPEGIRPAGEVGDHRVVYDQLGGHLRLHGHRVAAQGHHGVAHSRQVGDHGHSGEVLHEDPGR